MLRLRSILLAVLAAGLGLACAEPAPLPALPPGPPPTGFSGQQAFAHLEQLVAIGPRVPSTEGSEQARVYLRAQLEGLGLEVVDQTDETEFGDETVLSLHNLRAVVPGSSTDLIVLAAPYDSQDLGDTPFVGANDGASGAALLLELARVLAADPLPYTTWLVFLEREAPHRADLDPGLGFMGSRLLVNELDEAGRIDQVRVAVYFNQVADAELGIARDLRSHRRYRMAFFEAARRLGYTDAFPRDASFESPLGGHLAFQRGGVRRAVLITDDHYGGDESPGTLSHTEQDDLEHCSAESLEAVGRTSEAALRDITATLAKIDRFVRRPAVIEDPQPTEPAEDAAEEVEEAAEEATPETARAEETAEETAQAASEPAPEEAAPSEAAESASGEAEEAPATEPEAQDAPQPTDAPQEESPAPEAASQLPVKATEGGDEESASP